MFFLIKEFASLFAKPMPCMLVLNTGYTNLLNEVLCFFIIFLHYNYKYLIIPAIDYCVKNSRYISI